MDLNLQKELDLRKELVLDLKKQKGLADQRAQVVLALDYSQSITHLFTSGAIQKLVERVLPLGLAFDDNGEVDFYLFESGYKKMPSNITLSNIENYINQRIINKYAFGGTNYAPVINGIIADFAPSKSGGFLGFGKKSQVMDLPVYVIFITDGDNFDKQETERAIREASNYGIFFQFIGIGKASFPFLEKLDNLSGRTIDNANFFTVPNLAEKTDADLYQLLLTEFPEYITEARQKNLIK